MFVPRQIAVNVKSWSLRVLAFRCPTSDHEIVTHIDTDQTTLSNMKNMKLSLWCSHCERSHQVFGSEAYVSEPQDLSKQPA